MKLITENLHSLLLMGSEFHENRLSEAHTLLEGTNELCPHFIRFFDRQENLSQEMFTKIYSVVVKISGIKRVYGKQRCSSSLSQCQH